MGARRARALRLMLASRAVAPLQEARRDAVRLISVEIACAPRHGVVVTAEVFRTDRLQLKAAILPIRAKPL